MFPKGHHSSRKHSTCKVGQAARPFSARSNAEELVLNIGKLNENRKPARCQLFTRGCLFGRLSMTTCRCKTSFDGELLLALSKLATHPPFMGQCKHAITISSLSLSASNLPIQSTRDHRQKQLVNCSQKAGFSIG